MCIPFGFCPGTRGTAIVASTGATLWYQGLGNALILLAITAVLTLAPLLIVRLRKDSWLTDVDHALGLDDPAPAGPVPVDSGADWIHRDLQPR